MTQVRAALYTAEKSTDLCCCFFFFFCFVFFCFFWGGDRFCLGVHRAAIPVPGHDLLRGVSPW